MCDKNKQILDYWPMLQRATKSERLDGAIVEAASTAKIARGRAGTEHRCTGVR